MVSVCKMQEKYIQVQRSFCFYLELKDKSVARTLSKRIEDLGLRQEVFLTPQVTHVIRDTEPPKTVPWTPREGTRTRADAMLQKIRQQDDQETDNQHKYITLSLQKAILLLDKLYDTFFTAPIQIFKKHYIKVEFLDKRCRPLFKEFDELPTLSLEPDPIRESTETRLSHTLNNNKIGQKMTRKSRPRVKEREEKEPKGGYCEMCNADFTDSALHRRSPHHLAFVRDHTNFMALDKLISAGNDVNTFLEKNAPLNGERRSLRKICNGDSEPPKAKRSKRSQSPEVNGCSPKQNGVIDDCKKLKTARKRNSEPDSFYRVVNTKLRSSAAFAKQKPTPPCNGTKPLVVKFKKIRKSELSVLSDEAEQFMFPKRASSTSSTSSDDEEEKVYTPQTLERRRLARPVALKEESSEEDSWVETSRRRKKAPVPVRRSRRALSKSILLPEEVKLEPSDAIIEPVPEVPAEAPENISPLREEPIEKCMTWEDGKLKYTPAVEQLEFAFESVPHSEPWYETFTRQDQDQKVARNVVRYFSLYSKSPKLPYEIGQLPPLKPNCCPLSDLVKRSDKAGPSRSYGTRGLKKQTTKKIRNRPTIAQLLALEGHPRKSPREHASTLAILGSVGLLNRRKHTDDTKSTASEDTFSETLSNKVEQLLSEPHEASDRLQQFFSEIYEDAAEYEVSDELMEGDSAVNTSVNSQDVVNLVSECDNCEILRNEIVETAAQCKPRGKRSRFKKKNRTGWPAKKKILKKDSRQNSSDAKQSSTGSSAGLPDDESTQDSILSQGDETITDIENTNDATTAENEDSQSSREETKTKKRGSRSSDSSQSSRGPPKTKKRGSRSSASETDEERVRTKRKRSLPVGDWLQPVVRVARVDPNAARKLRSSMTKTKRGRKR